MSPQNSTLGLIGGNFDDHKFRSKFRSGVYRPEDNAYIKNYAGNIDNFYFSNSKFTYSDTISLSGIFVQPDLNAIHFCSGSTSSLTRNSSAVFASSITSYNIIGTNIFSGGKGDISNLSSSTSSKYILWKTIVTTPTTIITSWYPEATGISFKPDGSSVILCGNLCSKYTNNPIINHNPIIFQYDITSGYEWDVSQIIGSSNSTFRFSGTSYTVHAPSGGDLFFYPPPKIFEFGGASSNTTWNNRINDIFVHPDGLIFYYLRSIVSIVNTNETTTSNVLYQGTISSAWDIGTNGSNINSNTGSLTIDSTLVSSLSLTGQFSGISFNSTGKKLYLISKSYGGTIFQYSLSTAWDITTASFQGYTYVGLRRNEIQGSAQGIGMYPDDETLICTGFNNFTGSLYEYKILPY